jgi:hypothetical protein
MIKKDLKEKEDTMVSFLIKQGLYDYIPDIILAYKEYTNQDNLFSEQETNDIIEYGTQLIDSYFPMSDASLSLEGEGDKLIFESMLKEYIEAFIGMLNEAMRAMMTATLLQRTIHESGD